MTIGSRVNERSSHEGVPLRRGWSQARCCAPCPKEFANFWRRANRQRMFIEQSDGRQSGAELGKAVMPGRSASVQGLVAKLVEVLHEYDFVALLVVHQLVSDRANQHKSKASRAKSFLFSHLIVRDRR